MTTENVKNVENIKPIKRTVSQLLQLDSYQNMTDEEINSLIDFYKKQSYTKGYSAGNTAAQLSALDAVKSLCIESRERAEAAFNAAVNSVVKLDRV